MSFVVTWKTTKAILSEDSGLACTQVYVWLLTADKKLIIVSKDGKKWQLPGGKPEKGETLEQTAVREVSEETGLDISANVSGLEFIGYQVVDEQDEANPPYVQVRYALKLALDSKALQLSAQREDQSQVETDVIQYVEAVALADITSKIPWLQDSPELKAATQVFG